MQIITKKQFNKTNITNKEIFLQPFGQKLVIQRYSPNSIKPSFRHSIFCKNENQLCHLP